LAAGALKALGGQSAAEVSGSALAPAAATASRRLRLVALSLRLGRPAGVAPTRPPARRHRRPVAVTTASCITPAMMVRITRFTGAGEVRVAGGSATPVAHSDVRVGERERPPEPQRPHLRLIRGSG
jgi:hypothetical protein